MFVQFASDERLIAAEDAGRYRDALGAMPPSGLPEVFLESEPDPLQSLVARYARTRGPFTTGEANDHFGRDVEPELRVLEREEKLVRGELRPGGTEREWCDPDVLRRLRRASLAALRKEVEPAEQATLGRFLPSWHGVDRRSTLREALVPLQSLSLPVSLWESEVLPRRIPGYRPELLDQLCATGEVVWVGAGLDRAALFFREDASVLGRPAGASAPEGEAHDRIREALAGSAEFWPDLLASTGLEAESALPALWELVWAGEVTNDAWQPLRAGRRYGVPRPERRPRRFSRHRSTGHTATQGRWSLAERLFSGDADRRALAELLLERQGIVTRDGVRGEGIAGGYGAVYGELKALETLGLCRRGYFVEGLGGAQFALGGAVERLRELRPREDEEQEPLVLAAADPAQPYGSVLPWPKRSGRVPPASLGPMSFSSAGTRRSSSSGAGSRWYRCGIPIRTGSGSPSPRLSTTPAASRASVLRSSASTASRCRRANTCLSSSRSASSRARGGQCSGRSAMDASAPAILEIGLVLLAAASAGLLFRRLGLPAVVGYMLVGLLVSAFTPGYVADRHQLQLFADIGVVLLFFEVGIEIDPRELRARARAAAVDRPVSHGGSRGRVGRDRGRCGAGLEGCADPPDVRRPLLEHRRRQRHAKPAAGHERQLTKHALLGWSVMQDLTGVALAAVVLAALGLKSRPLWISLGGIVAFVFVAVAAAWLLPTHPPPRRGPAGPLPALLDRRRAEPGGRRRPRVRDPARAGCVRWRARDRRGAC